MTIYHSSPAMQSRYARGGTFPTAQEALRHAQNASDAFCIGYAVYECLDGRPKRLATFAPPGGRPVLQPDRKEHLPCEP
jgi:hypothetical protein